MRVGLCCLAWLVLTIPSHGAPEVEAAGMDVILLPTIQYAHQDIWTKTPNGRGPSNTGVGQVVRDYCEGILLRKELPAAEHGWRAGAFQVAVDNLKKVQGAKPTEPKPD